MTTPVPVLKIHLYDRIKTAIFLEVQGIPPSVKTPEQLTPAQVVALGATAGIGTIGRIVDDTLEITLASEVTIAYDEVRGFVASWLSPPSEAPAANRLEDLRREVACKVDAKHDFAEVPIGTLISDKLATLAYEGNQLPRFAMLTSAHRTAIAALAGFPTTARIEGDKIIVEVIGKGTFVKALGRWIAARETL